MKLLKNYILNFLSRSGSYVFSATIIARLFSFLASWLALKLISNDELGVVLFAYNIVVFIIPISGFGLHQSLIRYGALLKNDDEKNSLFIYVFKKGLWASLAIIALIIISSFFITFKFENTQFYVIILSFIILPSFIFEIIRAQFRLKHNNKSFAYTEFTNSIILLISVLGLSYFFKGTGYAIALLITPLLTSILFIKKLNINFNSEIKLAITNFSFWKYGFFASLSNVVTQLLFVIDIILIGYLLDDKEMITNYRYISIIPFSLLFLPRVFISTDFVAFTEKIFDKKYILNYIKSYMLFFSVVSVCALLVCYFFAAEILSLLDANFINYTEPFIILMLGITGIFIFRGLFGNLLSSIGKAHINYYISSIAIIINVITNYYLIPEYGITGAAITSAVLMWFTGILSAILFQINYNKVLSKKE
ncbi:polysaccharide biosynthesis C-terminal domain-containing protein [Polaribacter vadi]|uniref:polysaccharide biosynthesis C-terminal domain-containing protein n=1 Tax=Polaribacter TaxID=52959 RepID=UPI001C08A1F6|nr:MULTISPECIES: polysaccharide biosynthesis C-terminal domain-containing protein [Polaribacter]MBU3009866.1 polysaccharide biosynthesis C-terminal domain-containing protein [Polaribacter vadi]MDO6739672.1 polysaccharide biosynthesis C-terminal domain-containing protein [Polaribacter sp. 1_MG-2023]